MAGARPLPETLQARARSFLAGGVPVVTPKPAATVVLLRDTHAGPEVYLLRRHAGMSFAGGMYAFPGGGLDLRDTRDWPPGAWAGPSPQEWAGRLEMDPARAQAVVSAAVRETYEESGVLLAGHTPGDVLPGAAAGAEAARWERDRAALASHRQALVDVLRQRSLVLRSDLLAACAHWITPRFESRRFDAWFFLAALPDAQEARDLSGEADRAVWMSPGDALGGASTGALAMLPPTAAVLEDLRGRASVAEALAAVRERPLPVVLPEAVVLDGELRLVLPGEAGYPS